MDVFEAMAARRSIRKFLPREVPSETLMQLIDSARVYPSGGNVQPIRFALVTKPETRDAIFRDLKWAMYLPDFSIAADERPTAYVILLRDSSVRQKCDYDVGAASTMVMLAAVAKGLATCPILSFNKDSLSSLLQVEDQLVPELVLAVGYPAHESSICPMGDSVKYTTDAQGNFSVPKWSADQLLVYTD